MRKNGILTSRITAIIFALFVTAAAVLSPFSEMGKVYARDFYPDDITFGANETEKSVFSYTMNALGLYNNDELDPFSVYIGGQNIYNNTNEYWLRCPLTIDDGTYNLSVIMDGRDTTTSPELFDTYHLTIFVRRNVANPDPANPTNNDTGGKVTKDSTPPHTCHFEWVTETEATETSDGVEI